VSSARRRRFWRRWRTATICQCRKDHLVRVIHALIEGLVLQRLLTPELFPEVVIYAAFGASAAAPRPKSHAGPDGAQ
jgi:hypothetical protein